MAEKVRNNSNAHYGFDAQSETYGDWVEAGVIDPTKVTRSALQNAASIASLMLTTEALVSEFPEKEEKTPAAATADLPEAAWAAGCTEKGKLTVDS